MLLGTKSFLRNITKMSSNELSVIEWHGDDRFLLRVKWQNTGCKKVWMALFLLKSEARHTTLKWKPTCICSVYHGLISSRYFLFVIKQLLMCSSIKWKYFTAETSSSIPVPSEHNTVPESISFNTSLHIYWYLQHGAVNDTKTHGHQHLSSRAASETFAALPLLPTHFDHLLMGRHVLSLIVATTPALNIALHMGMSPTRDKRLLSIWEHTFGQVHSLLSSLPWYTGACSFWRKTAAPIRRLWANLYSPRPGISSKTILWLLFLPKIF